MCSTPVWRQQWNDTLTTSASSRCDRSKLVWVLNLSSLFFERQYLKLRKLFSFNILIVLLGALLFYPNKWCLCQNINNVICHNLCFSSFFVPSLCQIKIPMDTFVCARHSKGATTNCVLQPLPPWFQKHPGKTLHIECVLRPYVQTPHMKNGSCVCCFLITLMNFCYDQYRNWDLGYKDLRAFSIENSKFYLLCCL